VYVIVATGMSANYIDKTVTHAILGLATDVENGENKMRENKNEKT